MIALVALFRPVRCNQGWWITLSTVNMVVKRSPIRTYSGSMKPETGTGANLRHYPVSGTGHADCAGAFWLYPRGADMLRRAMGKKKPEEMAKQRSVFAEGAEKNGINAELAMKIFDLVEKFAGYGFNKSHSAAYALVSYQTLWLKAHYPAEFMAAVMTADMDNTEKVVGLVDECWRMGLKILPPDINSGLYHFHVNDDGEIVYGIGRDQRGR
ncbi:DNA polymerase III subunit alpha [Escherichia coli]|uniref:DNA polymerase III subunit alpha n=1 Tax=Escherichia coli TaxID=562 RepID=A0A377FA94_ECOLX|nr:DNA polymerase III subunit alpha [Escherichia coli]